METFSGKAQGQKTMQQVFSIAWEWIGSFWEWLAAAGVTAATMRGWFWWRGKKESEKEGGHAGQLSVVHAVAGLHPMNWD